MRTILQAQTHFRAWDDVFLPKDEIKPEQYNKWPGNTLANRLSNGDVKWTTVEGGPPEPVVVPPAPANGVPGFTDKATAQKWAKDKYGLDLDGRLSLETMVERINNEATKG